MEAEFLSFTANTKPTCIQSPRVELQAGKWPTSPDCSDGSTQYQDNRWPMIVSTYTQEFPADSNNYDSDFGVGVYNTDTVQKYQNEDSMGSLTWPSGLG